MEHAAVSLILFAFGIVLVVKGGDLFVDAASRIAKALGIPAFLIGATIVSIATTLPEMLVSVMAAADGMTDMAIGNAVGSVTANTGLIMALAMLFMPITVGRRIYAVPAMLLSCAAGTLWLCCLGGELTPWGSVSLLLIFCVFMSTNISASRSLPTPPPEKNRHSMAASVIRFLLGASGIAVGSELLVESGSAIAAVLGVPERIIAVTLIAVGTSLPELVTTVTAILKRESQLSVGNLIGANIIDLTLILPLCNLASGKPLSIPPAAALLDMPVCLFLILLAVIPMILARKAGKWQGILMLAVYLAYLVTVI